jgi:adenosylhomocysteine nucleosidase
VPSVIATVEAKRQLAARSGAQVVDMETHAVASVARAAGLDCASVRVVSDDASQELPREVAALAAPQPPLRRLGSVVGAIGKRPRAAVDLWRLWEHAVIDGRTLAEALADLLRSLPGRPSTS